MVNKKHGVPVSTKELIQLLENLSCTGCPYGDICQNMKTGCFIVSLAISKLKAIPSLRRDSFILGQMDMREQASDKLLSLSQNVYGISRATLESAADMVREMEVGK